MTKKKDLKRRVRERAQKTGESYTAARANLRKVPMEVAPDATREARQAGLNCTAVVSKTLRAAGDLAPLFTRLRELLEALGASMCGPLLRGESAPREVLQATQLAIGARRFLAQVRAGFRGLSADQRLFALEWNGATVVGGALLAGKRPLLCLGLIDDLKEAKYLALFGLGG